MTLPYLALNMQLPADVLDLLADCGVNWGTVSRKHGSILHYTLSHECDIDTVRYCLSVIRDRGIFCKVTVNQGYVLTIIRLKRKGQICLVDVCSVKI